MGNSATVAATGGAPNAERRWRDDRIFYTGMAVVVILTVFAGFARTYFLKTFTGAPPLPPLVHLHAILFLTWTILLLAQTTLIGTGRTYIHRRLGIAGAVLAATIVTLGYMVAIAGARRGFRGQFPDESGSLDALQFLILGLGDLLLFSSFVAAGLWNRFRPEVHKRFMLLATINLLPAAVTRIPLGSARLPVAFALLFVLVAAGPLYDWYSRGRVHPAYLWGGLITIISQPLRVAIASTEVWHQFAGWLIR